MLGRERHACLDRSVRPEPGPSSKPGSGVAGMDKTFPGVPSTWPDLPPASAPPQQLPQCRSSQRLPWRPHSPCFTFPPSPDGIFPVLLCVKSGLARHVSEFTVTQITERSPGLKSHPTSPACLLTRSPALPGSPTFIPLQ